MHYRQVLEALQRPPLGYWWNDEFVNSKAIEHAVTAYNKLQKQQQKLQRQLNHLYKHQNSSSSHHAGTSNVNDNQHWAVTTAETNCSSPSSSCCCFSSSSIDSAQQFLPSEHQSQTQSSVNSSNGSAYGRHHRYDTLSTAFHNQVDLYDQQKQLERQERFVQSCRNPPVPFVPAGNPCHGIRPLPTRTMLLDCVRRLYKQIAHDWKEVEPTILTTAEDLIVVFFSLNRLTRHQRSSAHKRGTIFRYMQNTLQYDAVMREFGLNKVSQAWNVTTKDGYLMFTLRPPWVKRQPFLPLSTLITTQL